MMDTYDIDSDDETENTTNNRLVPTMPKNTVRYNYDSMEKLCEFLDQDDMASLGQTCTLFLSAVRRAFTMQYNSKLWLCPHSNFRAISVYGCEAKYVSLNEFKGCYFDEKDLRRVLQTLEQHCGRLESLKVPIDNEIIMNSQFVRTAISQVTNLSITLGCRKSYDECDYLHALQNCPNVENLMVKFCCGFKIRPLFELTFPSLKKIIIEEDSGEMNNWHSLPQIHESFRSFIVRHSHLEHFEMAPLKGFELAILSTPELNAVNYVKLRFNEQTYLSNQANPILRQMRNLKDLQLCIMFTNVHLQRILPIPQVESLRLVFVSFGLITYSDFLARIREHRGNLQNMVEITLPTFRRNVACVSDQNKELMKMFPNLTKINYTS